MRKHNENFMKVPSNKVIEITCDKCGKKTKDKNSFFKYSSFIIDGWYGSKYDGLNLTIDLCDSCTKKFIKNLKINDKERKVKISFEVDSDA